MGPLAHEVGQDPVDSEGGEKQSDEAEARSKEKRGPSCNGGEAKVIAFLLSGHGHYDLAAYDAFMKNELEDYGYPEAAVQEALGQLPEVHPR